MQITMLGAAGKWAHRRARERPRQAQRSAAIRNNMSTGGGSIPALPPQTAASVCHSLAAAAPATAAVRPRLRLGPAAGGQRRGRQGAEVHKNTVTLRPGRGSNSYRQFLRATPTSNSYKQIPCLSPPALGHASPLGGAQSPPDWPAHVTTPPPASALGPGRQCQQGNRTGEVGGVREGLYRVPADAGVDNGISTTSGSLGGVVVVKARVLMAVVFPAEIARGTITLWQLLL